MKNKPREKLPVNRKQGEPLVSVSSKHHGLIKGTVAPVWRWYGQKDHNWEKNCWWFLHFYFVSMIFNHDKQKHPAAREMWRKWPSLRRYTLGNAQIKVDRRGAFPTRFSVNRKQEISSAFPSGSPHILVIFCLFPRSVAILLSLIKNRNQKRKFFKPSAVLLLFLLFLTIQYNWTNSNWCDSPFKIN